MKYEPERFWEERYGSLDLTRSGHRDLPEQYNRWLYRRKQAVLRSALKRIGFSPRDRRLLEIGAGIGAYLDFWKACGVRDLTGLDLSSSATAFLQERYPEFKFLHRDVTAPDLRHDTGTDYDFATALDVLYHVVDDDLLHAALRNVFETLRPGGIFALHDQFLHRPTQHHGYIRWRSLAQWVQALDAAGFEVLHRQPIFFLMIQPTDCTSARGAAAMDAVWDRTSSLIQRLPGVAGACTYAADSVLGAFLREGPSMELMLARRRG